MLIHLDTSVLVDTFTGSRRSLPHVRSATNDGHVLSFCAIVQYEWLRGPRTEADLEAVARFFNSHAVIPFGSREAETAASLYRSVPRARHRQADLAVAACALEHRAHFWTLNERDFADIRGLTLYHPL
jgi:predicted nucleic acid-binding protein